MADRRKVSKGKPKQKRRQTRTAPKEKTKEMTLPRLDAVEKMPSNAPTMAIAPSDYEHIFHEAAAAPTEERPHPTSPQASPASPPPQTPVLLPPPPPPPPRPQQPEGTITQSSRRNEADYSQRRENYMQDVQVTPDGYNLLGHNPEHSAGHRRIALPPYIVRANNQFSRAALARIARYLQSRADR